MADLTAVTIGPLMRALTLLRSLSLAGLSLLLACPAPPAGLPDAAELTDAAVDAAADSGPPDAGRAEGGSNDAGADDAGSDDGGADAGAGVGADGGPRLLGPAPLVAADASITIEDAGYVETDLLGRATLLTVPGVTLDGGFVVAVSAQSLVVAEGSLCQRSFVNRYSCDYRWLSPGGATLASVRNASGDPHDRGEVMMLFRDYRVECAVASRILESAIPSLMDLETGAVRLSWPRAESMALRDVLAAGDLVADPGRQESCDGGAPINFNPLTTFNRVRAPYEQLIGLSAHELGDQRLLLVDGGSEVSRIEADGGHSTVARAGLPATVRVELDTFTLRLGDQHYRGSIDGGALRPLATLVTGQQLGFEGGRFASVIEAPDPSTRRVIDAEGLVADLRYAMTRGQLLQRAPVMLGRDPANQLIVARVDQGTAATLPFEVSLTLWLVEHFPHDDAAIVIDRSQVAWLVETTGVKRLVGDAVNLPFRSFRTPPGAPNVLLVVRRLAAGGPLQLVAVDRQTRRIVTLSQQVFVSLSPSYLGGCDVPGLVTPGASFFYFAETTAQAGQINLFLVRSDLTEVPRFVGTTLANGCTVPVVSRDGTRVAVQETLGGAVTVKIGTW